MSKNVFQFTEQFHAQTAEKAMENLLPLFLAKMFVSKLKRENKKNFE